MMILGIALVCWALSVVVEVVRTLVRYAAVPSAERAFRAMVGEPAIPPRSQAEDHPISAQAQVTRAAKEVLLKRLGQSLRGGFVAGLGLNLAPIVELQTSEVPVLSVHSAQTDLLCRLADAAILHLEFPMNSTPDELPPFARYNLAVCEAYDATTWTVVLYGPGIG